MVNVALLARLEAKPGKEVEVANLLTSALPLANAEPATTVWFALKIGRSPFGIFDAFQTRPAGRRILRGKSPPHRWRRLPNCWPSRRRLRPVEVLAAKL